MPEELTKASRRTLKRVYDIYLERCKSGNPKQAAISFDSPGPGESTNIEGISDAKNELRNAGFIKADIVGGFRLTDKAIIFMENFNKDTVIKWLEFGTQFIP